MSILICNLNSYYTLYIDFTLITLLFVTSTATHLTVCYTCLVYQLCARSWSQRGRHTGAMGAFFEGGDPGMHRFISTRHRKGLVIWRKWVVDACDVESSQFSDGLHCFGYWQKKTFSTAYHTVRVCNETVFSHNDDDPMRKWDPP